MDKLPVSKLTYPTIFCKSSRTVVCIGFLDFVTFAYDENMWQKWKALDFQTKRFKISIL